MNNLNELFNVVAADIDEKRKDGAFSHGEFMFNASFNDRDDFTLSVNMWYNNIQIGDTSDSRKFYFDAMVCTRLGERAGVIIFDIDIDKKSTYLELIELSIPFRHRGIGKKLLEFMEYVSVNFDSKTVDGVYARNLCNYSQPFYESAGYRIYKGSSCEKVGKQLDMTRDFSRIEIGNIRPNKNAIVNGRQEKDVVDAQAELIEADSDIGL